MWANFAALTFVGLLVSSLLPKRWLSAALPVSVALAIIGGSQGMIWCTNYWD